MTTIRIPPGVVRGESKASVPGRWNETNLIRWQQGIMKPIGGWERMTTTPLASISRAGHVWLDGTGDRHRAYLCDGNVYREFAGAYIDITPPDFVDANSSMSRGFGSGDFGIKDFGQDDEDRGSGLGEGNPVKYQRFSLDNWGSELLFSSSADGRIFTWDPATPNVAPAAAAGAPSLVQSFIVTDEHHLMVFGAAGTPNRVAWSDQDNRTGWDFARVEGQAGFKDLEGAGMILFAIKIPGAILVFTSTSVWLGRYLGQPYFYGFNMIAEGCAPISAHAVAVAGSRAYWMGKQSFWKFEGGVVAPLPSTLGLEPFESMFQQAASRRVTAGFNGAYSEIWFFYPELQNVSPTMAENNRYAVFNFDEGWWTDGWMHRSFFTSSPLDGFPIAGSTEGYLYQHEIGYKAEGQPRGNMVYAEVGALSFDDGANNWQINQCQIDSPMGPDSVRFSFKGRRQRGGVEVPLQTNVTPRPDGFLDLHFTARDFSMRVEGNADGPWSLGAMVFHDVKKRGPV